MRGDRSSGDARPGLRAPSMTEPSSQAAPASSARTSSTPCSSAATRSTSSTTSRPAGARTSSGALAQRRRAGRGSTSATPRRCADAVRARAARGRLPPRRPDRRAQVRRRPGLRRARQRRAARSTCSSAAQAAGVGRVVFTSTGGAIYGEGQIIPAPEDHPAAPEAPYGQSKFCAEGYCALFTRLHGLSTVSLRYGNVYGPRQDPLGEAGVIAIFCGKLLDGGRPDRSSATACRRATTSTSATSWTPTCAPPTPTRPAPSTSAAASRRACSTSSRRSPPHVEQRLRGRARAGAPGRGAAHRARPLARAAELGWEAEVDLEQGLARTLDSLR